MRRFILNGLLPVMAVVLVTAMDASGAEQTWKEAGGRSFEAELLRFDPEAKTVVLQVADGQERAMATEDLALQSQVQILFSPRFLQSLPEEGWSGRRNRLVLAVIGITCLFFLAGFWLAAIVVAENFNPVRALVGWAGSMLFAGFLFFVYFTASRKVPELATGFMVAGGVVGAACASVFVSVVYDTKTVKGALLFVLHFVVAALLVAGAYEALGRWELPEAARNVIAEYILVPVGLL